MRGRKGVDANSAAIASRLNLKRFHHDLAFVTVVLIAIVSRSLFPTLTPRDLPICFGRRPVRLIERDDCHEHREQDDTRDELAHGGTAFVIARVNT